MSTPDGFPRGPTLLEEDELGLFQKVPRWGSLLEKGGCQLVERRSQHGVSPETCPERA